MKVKRTIKTKVDTFQKGDIIRFKLKDGEKVEAIAVKQVGDDMLFIHTDCLKKEYPMNENNTNEGGYENSDLRKNLNGEILEQYPDKIRKRMVAFESGDLLRIPTEKEIFGTNEYGEDEPDNVKQFSIMKKRRNRIAFQGYGTDEWEWYWLANKKDASAAVFAVVVSLGISDYSGAGNSVGVRPLFLLKNLES